jgi:hypothetical protein
MKNESKKAQNVRVIKNEEEPETPEVLAESIIKISKGFESLVNQGLTKNAIIVLIQGMPGVTLSKHDIQVVLDNLPKLASYYVKR